MEETENESVDGKQSGSGSSSMSRRSSKDESLSSSQALRPGSMSASTSQSSLGEKKGVHMGPFHFTLPRRKGKNKAVSDAYTLDPSVAQTKPLKKLKRSKSLKNSASSLLARVSGYVQAADHDGHSPATEVESSLPGGDSQKPKSKSNLASTLVRRISSVGKSKKRPNITKREEISPVTSQEEVEPEADISPKKTPLLPAHIGVVEELHQALSEAPHQALSEELPIPMEIDKIEADPSTAVEMIDNQADQEVHSYSCVDVDVDVDVSQSATSVPAADEVSDQSEQYQFSGPALEALEVQPPSVTELDCSSNGAAGGVSGIDDEANRNQSHRASECSTLSSADVTFRIRSAWMSQQAGSSSRTGSETGAGTPVKTAKDQILSITGPAWQKQQQEKSLRDQLDASLTETVPPVPPTDSAGTSAESSHPEVFSTPSGVSPDTAAATTSSSLDVDSFSPSSEPVLVSARAETSEESYSAPESPTEVSFVSAAATSSEDVMAEARARLSHSLGVASPGASTQSVQPGVVPGVGGDKREHLYKILVIGELGTGKTSIIKRYVHQFFSQHYRATIGVDFALKVLNWDANTIIRLQLWDIAGQERFGNMTRVYYKEAVAAFIVFDVTRAATFDAVLKWKQDLDSKVQLPDGSPIPCVLLANKCDQQKEGLVNYPAKMDEYCKDRGFAGWFETSAKENVNIEEAARMLVTKILANDQLGAQSDASKDGDKFNLGEQGAADRAKSKCSC